MVPRDASSSDPVIDAYKKDVDRGLLRENLKLTVEERWRKLIRTLRSLQEWRNAARPEDADPLGR